MTRMWHQRNSNRDLEKRKRLAPGSRVNFIFSVFSLLVFISHSDLGLVKAQSTDVTSCLCDGALPCDTNITTARCTSGRVVPRKDCSCCLVCAKQLSEACNDADLICDKDFGLICGTQGKCEPETSCVDDTECSNDRFCFGGACADPCKVLGDVCSSNGPRNGICSVRSHRALCSCPTGQSIVQGTGQCADAVPDIRTPSGIPKEKEEKPVMCHSDDGSVVSVGEKVVKCLQKCECGSGGTIICDKVEQGVEPDCKPGFIPITTTEESELTESCKKFIGNPHLFDGCCVPVGCKNGTGQGNLIPIHHVHQSRHFKFPDTEEDEQNGLRREDDELEEENLFKDKIGEDEEEDTDKLMTTEPSKVLKNLSGSEDDHKDGKNVIFQKGPFTLDGHGRAPLKETVEGVTEQKTKDAESETMKVSIEKTTAHSASIRLPVHEKGAILSIALSQELREAKVQAGATGQGVQDDASVQDGSHLWKEHMIPPGLLMLTLSDLTPNNSYTVKYTVGPKTYPEVHFSTPSDAEEDKNTIAAENQKTSDEIKFKEGEIAKPPGGEEGTTINLNKITSTAVNPKEISSTAVNPKEISSTAVNPKEISSTAPNPKEITSTAVNPKEITSTAVTPGEITSTNTPTENTSIKTSNEITSTSTPNEMTPSAVPLHEINSTNSANEISSTAITPKEITSTVINMGTNETEAEHQPSTISTAHPNATGCLFNNSLHETGAIVLNGCDTRCECLADGEMKCLERCSIPFFKKGTFAADPLCFEEPSGIDDCCVIVACARTSHAGMGRELSLNPCDTVSCGPNADCRYEVSPAGMQSESPNQETLCVCKETFSGDPYDRVKGCQLVSPTSTLVSVPVSNSSFPASVSQDKKIEGCISNNKTFSYGEEYLDGCSYKCHCEVSGEFLCLPRCNYRHDEDQKIPDGCEIAKDFSDPECCETLICAGKGGSNSEMKKEKTRVAAADGCLYKNQSYEKEEKFFDGCDQQCMCFSNGDVTCQPRCPPMGPVTPDKDCITLQDPTDPCCNVTICGNHTVSDVMKEAIELERKRLANAHSSTERARFLDESNDPAQSVSAHAQPPKLSLKLTTVMPINESAMFVSIQILEDHLTDILKEPIHIFYSADASSPSDKWSKITLKVKDLFVEGSEELHTIISGLDPAKQYFFQVEVKGTRSNVGSGETKSSEKDENEDEDISDSEEGRSGPISEEVVCDYKNKTFSSGEEFYDGCEEYCICEDNGTVSCAPLECPTDFGLDLVDAHCVKWEPVESEEDKVPPNCCSQMRCVQNSSCSFLGKTFRNFEEIPETLSGCEKRCYCEYGNVTCQSACPRLSEKPPKNLPCPPEVAKVEPLHYNECCMGWVCPPEVKNKTNGPPPLLLPNAPSHVVTNQSAPPSAPPGFHLPPSHHLLHHVIYGDDEDEDQLVPPSTGNQPSVLSLDRLHSHQLQELLHRLSAETDNTAQGHPGRPGQGHRGHGQYISAKITEQIRELERSGAKVVGHAPDGSVILFVPEEDHVGPPGGNSAPPPPPFPPRPPRPNFPHTMLPGANPFPFGPHLQDTETGLAHDEITGVTIRALNESTLHIDFTVSPVLVGLQGAVEVSYTNEFAKKPDPTQWEKQLFQQPEDIIDNSHLQLFLNGLKPNSEYHLQIQVIISSIHNSPVSDIFVIRTPPAALPPIVKIDPELKVLETTSRTLEISWRKFTDFEASLIDGVQVKYKAYEDQLYATSELIHRSLHSYKLVNLQPGKKYEVSLFLVPFTNQSTELESESGIHVETLPEVDDFLFSIGLESGKIGETTAELIWEGVPFPEDKFVNIFQVLYQSDNQKEQKSYFKVADRETTKRAVLLDLKPATRYRVWLEAFLTNGKKKRSNVIYVLTKVGGGLPSAEKSEQESNLLNAQVPGVVPPTTSYYGALVALAVVATFSIIGIIALLMILIKKQSQAKLPINDRKSESSYDNPSFKNYDMEANGHSNKSSEL